MNIRRMIYDTSDKLNTTQRRAFNANIIKRADIEDYSLTYLTNVDSHGYVRHYLTAVCDKVCNTEHIQLEASILFARDDQVFDRANDIFEDLKYQIKKHIKEKDILVYK